MLNLFHYINKGVKIMIVVPDIAGRELLKKVLTDENVILKLYKNDCVLDEDSLLSSFTDANFDGYSSKTLITSSWATPTSESPVAPCIDNEAVSTYAEQSWTCGSAGNTVYGYYVVGVSSANLLWADKFAVARVLEDGDILRIIPKLQLRTKIDCCP
jgi:hypothetical protein